MTTHTFTIQTLFGPEVVTGKSKPVKFRQIRAVFETLQVREEVQEYLPPDRRYTSPVQIAEIFAFLKAETKEFFFAAHLDGKNRIVCLDCISVGSLNQSIVNPREVFKTALLSSAAAVILIHNHPTGDPSPSREDIEITKRLVAGGELLCIRVIDHIIIGERHMSFVESGML
jgi:DNA repair protein RadC